MKLKFHNPIEQTVPDAMHTIKDVIENFFYLFVGSDNFNKVMVSKAELQRLGSQRTYPINLKRSRRN